MGSLSNVHACFMSCFQQASRDCRLLCSTVWRTVLAQPHPLFSTPVALQETVMSIGWVNGPVVGRFGSQICMHSRQSTQPAATMHVNTLKHSAGERAVHRLGDWAGGGWVWGPDWGLWDAVLHHCCACLHLLSAAVLAHAKGYAQALHAEGCANSRKHVPAPGAQTVIILMHRSPTASLMLDSVMWFPCRGMGASLGCMIGGSCGVNATHRIPIDACDLVSSPCRG